jgi:hypothetical protein
VCRWNNWKTRATWFGAHKFPACVFSFTYPIFLHVWRLSMHVCSYKVQYTELSGIICRCVSFHRQVVTALLRDCSLRYPCCVCYRNGRTESSLLCLHLSLCCGSAVDGGAVLCAINHIEESAFCCPTCCRFERVNLSIPTAFFICIFSNLFLLFAFSSPGVHSAS